ncbi:ABC transporter substrate-binding protein [Nonomuraea ferruginea]
MAAALAATLTLSGCGGGEPAGTPEAARTQSQAPQGPVKLTYWTWAPNMDKVVEVWNKAHPDIQVTVSKQAGGATTPPPSSSPRPRPATRRTWCRPNTSTCRRSWRPRRWPTSRPRRRRSRASSARACGGLVTLGTEGVYAVPQDSGPMMLFYRQDLFDEYGIEVPKTWDEYAEAARAVRKKDPKVYLGTFSSKDPGAFTGLAQQAGAQWWSISGEAWKVDIADAPTVKVADYWDGLVKEGAIDDTPYFTPEWNKALADGKLLTWPSAIWAPGTLESNAPKAEGKWAIAPMPQWNAGENHTGFWGGSSVAVAAKSPNRAAAARFATWLNTDPEAVGALVKEAAIYPAATKAQTALTEAPGYFANQPDFWQQAAQASAGARGFTFGPNVGVTYNAFRDGFDKALQDGSPFSGAVRAMHEATVADMRKSGFSLAS